MTLEGGEDQPTPGLVRDSGLGPKSNWKPHKGFK